MKRLILANLPRGRPADGSDGQRPSGARAIDACCQRNDRGPGPDRAALFGAAGRGVLGCWDLLTVDMPRGMKMDKPSKEAATAAIGADGMTS